jgi:hypothetical protein
MNNIVLPLRDMFELYLEEGLINEDLIINDFLYFNDELVYETYCDLNPESFNSDTLPEDIIRDHIDDPKSFVFDNLYESLISWLKDKDLSRYVLWK